MLKKRSQNILLLILFYLLSVLISTFYRNFIYKNKIIDVLYLADTGNNLFFVPSIFIITLIVNNKFYYGKYKDPLMIFLVFFLIELISFYFKFLGTYDFKDIIALFIGLIITLILVKYDVINVKNP